ncbi:jg26564 [Pararge aegeria aegeria]|uniref:Jg26564 protein n=1 Tax=Pararge aegeria aegeria TaxID=348720 RepID=A0A8S4QUC3_9NEOP|nr:jg26564 [Pararge aegeria aegeria]
MCTPLQMRAGYLKVSVYAAKCKAETLRLNWSAFKLASCVRSITRLERTLLLIGYTLDASFARRLVHSAWRRSRTLEPQRLSDFQLCPYRLFNIASRSAMPVTLVLLWISSFLTIYSKRYFKQQYVLLKDSELLTRPVLRDNGYPIIVTGNDDDLT